jgi:ribosomal protein L34E
MAWRKCKVCSTAREFVDSLLDDGEELRVISARLALLSPPIFIDKSSIHRHSKKCYSVRERAQRRKELARAKPEAEIVAVWPGEVDPASGQAAVVVEIEFEQITARNPLASHLDQKEEAREQVAAEETAPEEKPGLLDRVLESFRRKTKTEPAAKMKPADPPGPCPHTRQRETPSGPKCDDCGKMLQAIHTPRGAVSRADYFSTRGRARFGLRN